MDLLYLGFLNIFGQIPKIMSQKGCLPPPRL
ncbi:hypothetical protein L1276_003619 [Flavobacterium sp. HSC-32F16]|nr:hypothetical protein [Flavobacterium sp. HSC-32F16]